MSKSSKSRVLCVTSGKGGVGKTTSVASLGLGLARKGHRVCCVDFDFGLRNLDLHFGMEKSVLFDMGHVIEGRCTIAQALVVDNRYDNLSLLAASQTKDKDLLNKESVGVILENLRGNFEYILCDSPAGIESGAFHAMYHADEALICTNPELSSVRDADKMISLIGSRSKRADTNQQPVKINLLITRYDKKAAKSKLILKANDIKNLLDLPLLGIIPETCEVVRATNIGEPVICGGKRKAGAKAYQEAVDRYLGLNVPITVDGSRKGIFASFFG